MRSLSEIIDDLGDIRSCAARSDDVSTQNETDATEDRPPQVLIFGCPARDAADSVALQMLEKVLDPARWQIRLIAPETLTAELLELIAQEQPAAVCIASLAPGGLAHTRYVCKRLSGRFPDLRIIVGRWGEVQPAEAKHRQDLEDAGASSIAFSLIEARQKLDALFPLLESARRRRGPGGGGTCRYQSRTRQHSQIAPSRCREGVGGQGCLAVEQIPRSPPAGVRNLAAIKPRSVVLFV